MARRPKTKKAPSGSGLSPELSSSAPEPTVDPSVFAPLDTDWVDAMEDETPSEEIPLVAAEADTETPVEPSPYTARVITDADVDRLWDWVRKDEDRGHEFLGIHPETSKALYDYFAAMSAKENADAVAIVEGETHIGFVTFNPIDRIARSACVHIYLDQAKRGEALTLLPQLLRLFDEQFPHYAMVILTAQEAAMRLYRQLGFEVKYLLMRSAS